MLDQALGADRLVRVHEQDGEQRALPLAAQRKGLSITRRHERPEDPELHGRGGLRTHRLDYQETPAEAQQECGVPRAGDSNGCRKLA